MSPWPCGPLSYHVVKPVDKFGIASAMPLTLNVEALTNAQRPESTTLLRTARLSTFSQIFSMAFR